MSKAILAAVMALSSTLALAGPRHEELPLNPSVTPETIAETICVKGYSRSVRPPQAYTRQIKIMRLREAGLPPEDAAFYELDHRIAIAAGGAPSDPRNLALQPWPEAREKDKFENRMHSLICDGRVSLREAQQALWDWRP